MLDERTRYAYLTAMGIDSWLPRYQLPNAEPSSECEWQALPEGAADPALDESLLAAALNSSLPDVSQHRRTASDSKASAPSGSGQMTSASVLAGSALAASALAELDLGPAKVEAEASVSKPTASVSTAQKSPLQDPAPNFRLGFWAVGGGLLVVDDEPNEQVSAQRLERLLRAIVASIGVSSAPMLQAVMFHWPMIDNPQVDQGATVAAESLFGFLSAQCDRHQLQRMLLLGETAEQWLCSEAMQQRWTRLGLTKVASCRYSLQQLHDCPLHKKVLWQQLQSLR